MEAWASTSYFLLLSHLISQLGQLFLNSPNFPCRLQHYKVSGYAPGAYLVAAEFCIKHQE